jgi:hypothetical protein
MGVPETLPEDTILVNPIIAPFETRRRKGQPEKDKKEIDRCA